MSSPSPRKVFKDGFLLPSSIGTFRTHLQNCPIRKDAKDAILQEWDNVLADIENFMVRQAYRLDKWERELHGEKGVAI